MIAWVFGYLSPFTVAADSRKFAVQTTAYHPGRDVFPEPQSLLSMFNGYPALDPGPGRFSTSVSHRSVEMLIGHRTSLFFCLLRPSEVIF